MNTGYTVNDCFALPNDKTIDCSKFKAFADDNLNMTENLKTLWEKEKMLVTIIFSFSHNVFKKGCFFKVEKSQDCEVES